MAGRLGEVLYWAANIVAGAMVAFIAWAEITGKVGGGQIGAVIFGVVAALIWLAGRGLRYIFSGR